MALSDPRVFYGIHSFSPYSRTDGTFYGILKVLKGSSLALTGDMVDLKGGSAKYPWASEESGIEASLTLKAKEYPNFLYELFLGKAPTPVVADADGAVTSLTNKKGTSCMVATTGIASVGLKSGSSADLKFGKYVVKVAAAATVNVYFSSDADIARGTDGTYQDDTLKVTATALTIATGAPTEIPNFGLELTGGSGTIGMTVGDTATFEVLPIHSGAITVTVGAAADTFPEFGAIIMGQKRGNGELVEIDAFRCKGAGLPHSFEEKAWSENEIKIKMLYDSVKDGLFSLRHVKTV